MTGRVYKQTTIANQFCSFSSCGYHGYVRVLQTSGLSAWIGDQLLMFDWLPSWLMMAVVCFFISLMTEVITNSAATTLILPVMASLVRSVINVGSTPPSH